MAQLAEPVPAASARPAWLTGETIGFIAMVAILVIAPAFIYPVSLMKALCFALFACAFNLLIGYVGLLSFGHALFFGWAAYIAAHLAKVGTISLPYWRAAGAWQWLVIPLPPLSPELAILGGTVAAGVLGLIAGAIAIRRQGIYFAMITLALAQMMYFFAVQAPFTHGEDGIQAVPRGWLFGVFSLSGQTAMYITVLVIFLLGFLLIYRIINSPFGEVLKAIRENEARAISLGYKTERYKLVAFVMSATLAGTAGATKAIVFQLASLTDVDWPMSGEVVLMTLVGGLGTIFGPVVGAFIVIAMQDNLAHYGQWVTVIQGAIFVACVLAFRRGIVGEIANYFRIRL
jgi:branched-chain amino acid transport system permease protein